MSSERPDQQEPSVGSQAVKVSTPAVKPMVTFALIIFTFLIYALQLASEYITGYDWLFIYGGKINEVILAGEVWRLITPVFLHSSIPHIVFNMYALYILGRRSESVYGHARFTLLYFLSAFGGNVLSFVLSPSPSLGSSTAIFGLLAAEGVFIFQNRRLFGKRTKSMLSNIIMVLFLNLAIGFSPSLNIDYFGHLGGLLAGFLFASLSGPKLVVEGLPPNLILKDSRSKGEIRNAVVFVTIGFVIMSLIPLIFS